MVLLVLTSPGADAGTARGSEPVEVRFARHDAFARLVLDWPRPVEISTRQRQGTLVVTTGRGFEADFALAGRTLAPWLSAIDHASGTATLRLDLRAGVEVRRLAYAPDLVVLDFLGTGEPDADPPALLPEPDIRIGRHPEHTRLVMDWTRPNATRIERKQREIRLSFDRPGHFDLDALAGRLGPFVAALERDDPDRLVVRLRRGIEARVFTLDGDRTVIDFMPGLALLPAAAHRSGPPSLDAEELPISRADARQDDDAIGSDAARDGTRAPGRPAQTARPFELTLDARASPRGFELAFAWSEPVPAAVFVRAGALWAIFGARPDVAPAEPIDWGIDTLAGLLGPAERIPLEQDAFAFRFPLLAPAFVRVVRDRATWRVHLGPEPQPQTSLTFASAGVQGLVIRRTDGGAVVRVDDPTVGDRLGVWPLLEPAGVTRPRKRVHFEVLAAAQGVVWRPRSDRLAVRATDRELVLAPRAAGDAIPRRDDRNARPPAVDLARATASPDPVGKTAPVGSDPLSGEPPDPSAAREEAAWPVEAPPGPPKPKPIREQATEGAKPRDVAVDRSSANARGLANTGPAIATPVEASGRASQADHPIAATTDRLSPWLDIARFATTEGEDATARRIALLAEVMTAPVEARQRAQLDLTRFLIAHDLGVEAMSVLLASRDGGKDGGWQNDRLHAAHGAASFLMARHQAAAAALARPALDGDPEIALWRAATQAELGAWEPAKAALGAADDVLAREVLASYPLRLQFRLGLPVARIHAYAGRATEAFAILDRLSESRLALTDRRRLEFTRGLVYRDIGAVDAADARWQRLEGGARDRTGLEAALARRIMLVEAGRLSPEQALDHLYPLRPAWRGHPKEADQLDALAGMLAVTGRTAEAIRLWQEALDRSSDPELAAAVERSQRAALVDALLASGDAWVGPLRAYALYRDFQELLPEDVQGVQVRRGLAERLARIDQLDAAAGLLKEALAIRPGAALRAELGAELGALWLRYPDPERALAALDATTAPDLSVEVARQRALLRARAALGAGDPATARAALAPFEDPEAARIRAEMLWAAGDWPGLQAALRPLIDPGEPEAAGTLPELPADARRTLLVEFALASLAADDQAALEELVATQASQLAGTVEETPFRLITVLADAPRDPAGAVDAAARRVEAARAFLEHR